MTEGDHVARNRLWFKRAHFPLKLETWRAEIQEQSEIAFCGGQIIDWLDFMCRIQSGHRLQL